MCLSECACGDVSVCVCVCESVFVSVFVCAHTTDRPPP